jgi:hypothetical protein
MVLPYLKGFLYNSCVHSFVSIVWMIFYFKLNFYLLFSYLLSYTTIGIRALSWAKKGKIFFFFFVDFSREKEDGSIQSISKTFMCTNLKKQVIDLSSS